MIKYKPLPSCCEVEDFAIQLPIVFAELNEEEQKTAYIDWDEDDGLFSLVYDDGIKEEEEKIKMSPEMYQFWRNVYGESND